MISEKTQSTMMALSAYHDPRYFDLNMVIEAGYHPDNFEEMYPEEYTELVNEYGDNWKNEVWGDFYDDKYMKPENGAESLPDEEIRAEFDSLGRDLYNSERTTEVLKELKNNSEEIKKSIDI